MIKTSIQILLTLSIILGTGCRALAQESNFKLSLTSKAFTEGSTIPVQFTGDGKDVSPPLTWSEPPKGTKTLALTCEDPDAPSGTWFHWIIFNMPPVDKILKENVQKMDNLPEGIKQGKNDFGKPGYNGPSPPKGPVHHYNFKIFALNDKLDLKAGCTKQEFYKALKGKVLAKGMLTGLYQRK